MNIAGCVPVDDRDEVRVGGVTVGNFRLYRSSWPQGSKLWLVPPSPDVRPDEVELVAQRRSASGAARGQPLRFGPDPGQPAAVGRDDVRFFPLSVILPEPGVWSVTARVRGTGGCAWFRL